MEQPEFLIEKPGNSSLTVIAGIPLAIVQEHHHVLYFWQQQGIQNATLIHIDAHGDMDDSVEINLKKEVELNIQNFVAAANYLKIIKEVYWLNPHSKLLKVFEKEPGNTKLETILETNAGFEKLIWAGNAYHRNRIINNEGKSISEEELNYESPLILDIDLDAFSCQRAVCDITKKYDGQIPNEVKQRFDLTKGFLERQLEKTKIKPNLITIARSVNTTDPSQYWREISTYVDPDKVDDVQKRTIEMLKEVYE